MGGGPTENVLISLPVAEPKEDIQRLKDRFPGITVTYHKAGQEPVPVSWYKDITVLFTLFGMRSRELPPDPKKDSPNLQYVHFYSAGINQAINHPIYTDTTIPLTSANGVHGPQISEWAIMTRLVASHNYNSLYEAQKEHHWDPKGAMAPIHREMRDQAGQRVGVLGYGSIGRQVARVCRGMGMDVVAYTASPKETPESRRDGGYIPPGTGDPDGSIPSRWYSGTSKEDLHRFLGADLDWVVVSVPLTPATKHFLGAEEFKVLSKKRAFLSNISRGDILDQHAFVEALKNGELGGAAVDVATPEPLPEDSELWSAPNLTITPHISGLSSNYTRRCFDILIDNLERKSKGERLLNLVDRKKGY